MKKTYYKVLRIDGRRSFNSNRYDCPISIEYKKAEWTRPLVRGTPLFVFADKHSADSYRAQGGNRYITVPCNIIKWRGRKFSRVYPGGMSGNSYRNFVSAMKEAYLPLHKATVLASKVFCLE